MDITNTDRYALIVLFRSVFFLERSVKKRNLQCFKLNVPKRFLSVHEKEHK
jgi:hypothetical protein